MSKIHIKQLNNSGASTGSVVLVEGSQTLWSENATGALRLPSGATEDRPAGTAGLIRFNAETARLEVYFGDVWEAVLDSRGDGYVATGGDTMSGTLTMQPGAVLAASDGTAAAPGIAFASDLHTGMFRPSDDRIGFTLAENRVLTLSASVSPANHLEIRNAPLGSGPRISVMGTDPNADIVLVPRGTGVLSVAETTGYETLVTADNDIPNKRYVDNVVAAATAHGPNLIALGDLETTGLYVVTGEGTSATRSVSGTANQITVANGSGVAGDITLSLAANPVLPGTEAVRVPTGTTVQRPSSGVNGTLRYNSETEDFEFFKRNGWVSFYDVSNHATGLKLGGAMYVSGFVPVTPYGPIYTGFGIGAGEGTIVDGHTNPHQPTATLVQWNEMPFISPQGLGTRNVTFVMIDINGNVVQQGTDPTSAQLRDHIYLGFVLHLFGAVQLTNNQPNIAVETGGQLLDFMNGVGIFNKIGNLITPATTNAPLRLSKTAGIVFKSGIGYQSDRSNPHEAFVPAMPECLLNYVTISGASIPNVYDLDPTLMVVNGTFAPVPGDGHVATVQRIYLYPMGMFIAFPGQKVYDSLGEAIAGQATEPFEIDPYAHSNGVLVALVAMTKDCTDIRDPKKARIIYPDRFGTILTNSAAIPTFQNIYDTSVTGNIRVDTRRGAFRIRDGVTPLSGEFFAVQGSDGTALASFAAAATTFSHDLVLGGTGRLKLVAGTAANPALQFAADAATGLRQPAAGSLSLVANGQDALSLVGTPSGVNGLSLTTGISGGPVVLAAESGTDANVSVVLRPKGTGVLSVTGTVAYESRVTDPDDIPNKQYVDDLLDSVTNIEDLKSAAGTVILDGAPVSSAVNHVVVRNAVTGEAPEITVFGPSETDPDVDLVVAAQGAGYVMAPAGYTMAAGPATAFVTRAYVDAQTGPQGMSLRQVEDAAAVLSEPMLFVPDTTRSKILSVESHSYTLGRSAVAADSWLQVAGLSDEAIGVLMPYPGTLVRAAAICSDAGGHAKTFSVYVDGVETTGVLTISGSGFRTAHNTAVSIDFPAGARIRIRARDGTGDALGDTSVTFSVKWRFEE